MLLISKPCIRTMIEVEWTFCHNIDLTLEHARMLWEKNKGRLIDLGTGEGEWPIYISLNKKS